jgi:hypothetical protein
VEQAGREPERVISAVDDLAGLGEHATIDILCQVMANSNLTVPLVRTFKAAAEQEGHDAILQFLASLDVFSAIGPPASAKR